jgi:hypothetical protein
MRLPSCTASSAAMRRAHRRARRGAGRQSHHSLRRLGFRRRLEIHERRHDFQTRFDKQPVQSIGAVTIDPKNPKTVWVGTGEAWTRNSVSIGNGVYRSVDGGENWRISG